MRRPTRQGRDGGQGASHRRRTPEGENPAWGAVLFDLDGTLADSVPFILESFRHTMRTHRGKELPDSEWLRTIGIPLRDQLRLLADSDGEMLAMLETYKSFQRASLDGMINAFPGARDVGEALVRAGTRLAIVTSKTREMTTRTLDSCGLSDLFDQCVCADDVERGKPDPEPVMLALEQLGLERRTQEVLFVGDSPFDIASGLGAGVRTAAALWGAFGLEELEAADPHHLVTRLEEVLELRPLNDSR